MKGTERTPSEARGDLVWEIGTGYFGCRERDGRVDPGQVADNAQRDAVKTTEIKLSQGAQPGRGGLLPARKVTEEIVRVRQVPAFRDCLSPRAHSACSTPVEMLELAARFHEKTLASLADIVAAAGLTRPQDLQPHHLTTRISAAEARPMGDLHVFLPENALIEAPEEAANAESFRPRSGRAARFTDMQIRSGAPGKKMH